MLELVSQTVGSCKVATVGSTAVSVLQQNTMQNGWTIYALCKIVCIPDDKIELTIFKLNIHRPGGKFKIHLYEWYYA